MQGKIQMQPLKITMPIWKQLYNHPKVGFIGDELIGQYMH